jgi:hypothetical protein
MYKPFRHEEEMEKQLRAMETSHFDLRIVNPQGKVVDTRDELFVAQIKDITEWLHEKNEKGNRVEVRPSGEHGISLVSGLSLKQVDNARISGLQPALVVAYGKDQFQVWLKHDRKLSAEQGERATQQLCEQIGADCEHSHWDSFGYLCGFVVATAGEPFRAELVAHSGEVFSQAESLNDTLA